MRHLYNVFICDWIIFDFNKSYVFYRLHVIFPFCIFISYDIDILIKIIIFFHSEILKVEYLG